MVKKKNLAVFRRFLAYLRPYKGRVFIAVVGSLLVAGSNVAIAKLIQPLVDKIIAVGDASLIKFVPLVVVALAIVKGVARYGQEYFIKTAGQLVVQDLRNEIYTHSLSLSMGYFSRHSSGQLLSKIINDIGMLQRSAADVLVGGVRESFSLIGLVVLAFYNDWKLASVAFLVLPVAIIPATVIGRKIKNNTRKGLQAMGGLSAILQETYAGIKVVKSFGREKDESSRFFYENQRYYHFIRKVLKYNSASAPIVELLGSLGMAGVAWYGLHRVFSGAITQGELFSFIAAVAMMYGPVKRLSKVSNLVHTSVGAAERVFEVIDEKPEITFSSDPVSLGRARGAVAFHRVTFAYDSLPVLKGVSLTVSAGEVVALVGPSGSGKTTMVGLLNRFYDPQEGVITIDGVDIRRLSLADLTGNIALVDQETFLFHDTIMNNIRYGRQDASNDEVVLAARQACADEFIDLLPEKYETSIGDRGLRLSGGQRQRICIARAILRDAPILILDEATSALDTESESMVQKALANLMANRTTFVIAHRLSTVRYADTIVVLEGGEIRDVGSHEDLLAKDGLYKKLYEMQFEDGQ
ncbi:MAG TPA: ATP-binding cassette domain-containing protein [Proteobacteria bacterium]|nr:ATP-binding cassette domain-containing protein [Pseudomonadota bacterium]